MDPDGDE
jgi:hypothetical protein